MEVKIIYCRQCNFLTRAIRLTEEVLPQYHNIISSWSLVPGEGREFMVKINDKPVFSKLESGRFIGEIELRLILDGYEIT